MRRDGVEDGPVVDAEMRLASISVNVHMGGVGYEHAYYSPTADNVMGEVQWTLTLTLTPTLSLIPALTLTLMLTLTLCS